MTHDIKEQPKSNFILAFLLICVIAYIIVLNPQDREYHKETGEELALAKVICEVSLDWVLENRDRIKLGNSDLENFKPDGKNKAKFQHIKYPEILFYDTGIRGAANGADLGYRNLYCTYSDPRDGHDFYFDYNQRRWVDKIRFHR